MTPNIKTIIMQSLYREYISYLQLINEFPKKMLVAKFGWITFEFLGVFSFLYTLFKYLGDLQSIVLFFIAVGYALVRLFFTIKRGLIRAELEKEGVLKLREDNRKLKWEQDQREKSGK